MGNHKLRTHEEFLKDLESMDSKFAAEQAAGEKMIVAIFTLVLGIIVILCFCTPPTTTVEAAGTTKVSIIRCKVPTLTPRGFEVIEYMTSKEFPLYRGGWDFYTLDGNRVLSTSCHHDSSWGEKK